MTGGDTYHYTNEDCRRILTPKSFSERRTLPSRTSNTSNTDCGRRPQDLLNLLGVNKYALYRATTFKTHHSPSGNWTPVSRVTGGDTYHYTNEDCRRILTPKSFSERRTLPSRTSNTSNTDCGRRPQDLLNLLGVNKYALYRATTFKTHHSPSGKWTPVSRVTGGDTYHYTNEDCRRILTPKSFSERRTLPSRTSNTSNTDCGRRPQDLLNLLGVNKYALYRATTFKTHHSPSGNWTPVSRVTGGDTYHYTNEDCRRILTPKSFSERRTLPSRTSNTSNTDCGRRPQDLLNLLGVNKYALYRATTFKTHHSPSGNWTPVSRVTGGDTYHYTNEDCRRILTPKSFSERRTLPSRTSNTSNTDCGRRPQDLLNLLGVNKYALYRATTFKTHHSPSGNWTPVSRVTGGDTYHYTNEDCRRILTPKSFSERRTLPSRSSNRWLRTTSSRPPKFIRGQQVRSLSRHDLQNAPLPVGELNPGLPRDRRGYLPLY